LPVDAADRPLVAKAHPRGDLLVRQSLREQSRDTLLGWLQQIHRRVLVLVAHLLHARFDFGVNETAPRDCVAQ